MSTWSLNSVGAKYDTAKKGVVTSEVKFNLWKKGELKVAHKSGTNDVAVKVETKTPIEFSVEHDVRPKNTTLAAKAELFNDRVDLKIKQVVPGNKWSVVPSPRLDFEYEPSKKFESNIHWDFAKRTGGAKVKSQPHKMHEIAASAEVNSSFQPKELCASYEFMPRKKWADEFEVSYSSVKGAELQWETKPTPTIKTDLKANLKSKKLMAELEWKNKSKQPTLKTVLKLGAPITKPQAYAASCVFQTEYKF
mmetsp:Transcript_22949/g.57585  ORF Transcript_22949/g.57585 Transcript_22949/m.57585 type:complete len:250 (+) Transcript_22949:76-825(+)